jgi:hypothetical protein
MSFQVSSPWKAEIPKSRLKAKEGDLVGSGDGRHRVDRAQPLAIERFRFGKG